MSQIISRLAAVVSSLLLSGCTLGASMNIDVEVYKGPLSKTVAVQEEELCAQLVDAERAFDMLYDRPFEQTPSVMFAAVRPANESVRLASCRGYQDLQLVDGDLKFSDLLPDRRRTPRDCPTEGSDALRADICWAQNMAADVLNHWLATETSSVPLNMKNTIHEDLLHLKRINYANAARLGAALRNRASYWASIQAASPEPDVQRRIAINNFAQFLAEAGNQIVSRADALLMQQERLENLYKGYFGEKSGEEPAHPGVTQLSVAQRLATSLYLRDSNATAYQNLLDWNRNRKESLRKRGDLDELDSVRMVEELMQDTHWSKINTVHANGKGEVRMVFIKDDIGNWNLKSFTSDPEELLRAYNDVVRGAAGQALSLMTSGGAANKVGSADKLLSFANRALVGAPTSSEPTLAGGELSVLRDRISNRLVAEKQDLTKQLATPAAAIKEKTGEKTVLETDLSTTREAIKTYQDNIKKENPDFVRESEPDRAAACDPANSPSPPPAAAGDGGGPALAGPPAALADNCSKLKTELDRAAQLEKDISTLTAEIAAGEAEIAKIKEASVERARIILRDHAIVVGAIEEVMNAKPADTSQ